MLFITQSIDTKDTTLGFVHEWVRRLSATEEKITVIALRTGTYNLPSNVTVYSLGKEKGATRLQSAWTLLRYIWSIRNTYTKVFVHMNQEYIVLLGLYWRMCGTKIFFWRNHPKGNVLTDYAVYLSTKVFYTSPASYTARYAKSICMPTGIDLSLFGELPVGKRKKYSFAMIGRVSPIKHIELGILALERLHLRGIHASFDIIGDTPEIDMSYRDTLLAMVKEKKLETHIRFLAGVPKEALREVYNTYEICLNLTDTGSFDKTIVEAAACGTIPVTSNSSLAPFLPPECLTSRDVESLALRIEYFFEVKHRLSVLDTLHDFAQSQSLDRLMEKFKQELV